MHWKPGTRVLIIPRQWHYQQLSYFFCPVMATLAIAFVIPADQLNLAAGVMQAIQYFFTALGIPGRSHRWRS